MTPSGTLPVLYIDTENGTPITSKEDYLTATLYVSVPEGGGDQSGSLIKIRGRGNWTWTNFEKKPYKVKFSEALSFLGMGANRHWALLSHPDDGTGFLRNALGFEMGRMMGLPFTPHQVPAELVLNGDYVGVYVVTETVRVDENRVDIVPQEDGETDALRVEGGWLVEIDNYEDPNQMSFDMSGLPPDDFRITWHTPEVLSQVQYDWLYNQFSDILRYVYVSDKSSRQWEEYIDLDMLARYYVVAEIIDHVEFFFGSTFFYKASADGKWMAGPMWDLGHALNGWHDKNKFIYDGLSWGDNLLTEISKFPRFQERAKQIYAQFMREHGDEVFDFIDRYCEMMEAACHANYLRWNYYGDISGSQYAESAKQTLRSKIAFLDKVWGRETSIKGSDYHEPTVAVAKRGKQFHEASVYDLQGRKLPSLGEGFGVGSGIYIVNGKKVMKK